MTDTSAAALPPAVAAYLAAPKDQVGAILDQVFTSDAVVHDEGRTHVGLDAIRAWNAEVAAAFNFTRTIRNVALPGNAAVVVVKLEGNFPGSPVELYHHFSVVGERISAMTICP
jgi:hypothetical protein